MDSAKKLHERFLLDRFLETSKDIAYMHPTF